MICLEICQSRSRADDVMLILLGVLQNTRRPNQSAINPLWNVSLSTSLEIATPQRVRQLIKEKIILSSSKHKPKTVWNCTQHYPQAKSGLGMRWIMKRTLAAAASREHKCLAQIYFLSKLICKLRWNGTKIRTSGWELSSDIMGNSVSRG